MGLPPSCLSSGGEGFTVLHLHCEQIDDSFGSSLLFLFLFSLFFFSIFFLSLFFSPDTQALQCMLVSLQAELDIQRYLMKIESSQRVSTFSSRRTSPLLPSLGCVWRSNLCQPVPFPALVSPSWSQTLAASPDVCIFV